MCECVGKLKHYSQSLMIDIITLKLPVYSLTTAKWGGGVPLKQDAFPFRWPGVNYCLYYVPTVLPLNVGFKLVNL